jgi:hypothetical protein
MSPCPTTRELAEDALAALRRHKDKYPGETFDRLVQLGWINSKGEVTRLLGGDAEPEVPVADENTNGAPVQKPLAADGSAAAGPDARQ